MRGGWRERKRDREGCGGDKNNNMNFSLLSSMDFPPHQISVGPDETKVIRETQAGHLTAITGMRPHCLWSKANTASLVRKVEKKPILVFPDLLCQCCRVLHNITKWNVSDWPSCEGTCDEIDGLVIYLVVPLFFFCFLFQYSSKTGWTCKS